MTANCVALGLGALLFFSACGKSSRPLSGASAGKQAAESYCDCLRKEPPPGGQEKNPAADERAETDGKGAKASGRRGPGMVEKRIADCTQSNEARFDDLMSRVPRTVEQAQEFSNTFHGLARECEDALRKKLEGAGP